jgi:hypothetical protein
MRIIYYFELTSGFTSQYCAHGVRLKFWGMKKRSDCYCVPQSVLICGVTVAIARFVVSAKSRDTNLASQTGYEWLLIDVVIGHYPACSTAHARLV